MADTFTWFYYKGICTCIFITLVNHNTRSQIHDRKVAQHLITNLHTGQSYGNPSNAEPKTTGPFNTQMRAGGMRLQPGITVACENINCLSL